MFIFCEGNPNFTLLQCLVRTQIIELIRKMLMLMVMMMVVVGDDDEEEEEGEGDAYFKGADDTHDHDHSMII